MPLGDVPDISARFTFVVPNLKSDTHDAPVAYGDRWLAQFVPKLLATPQYATGRTAIFVTWDEDDGGDANHIATLVIAPAVRPGTRVDTRFTHLSLLRTTAEMLGLGFDLGGAAMAPSMRRGFRA